MYKQFSVVDSIECRFLPNDINLSTGTFNPSNMADTTTAPTMLRHPFMLPVPPPIHPVTSCQPLPLDRTILISALPPTPLRTTRFPPRTSPIRTFTRAISAPPSQQSPRRSNSPCSSNASNEPTASRYTDRPPQPLICSPTLPRPAWTLLGCEFGRRRCDCEADQEGLDPVGNRGFHRFQDECL